MHFLFRQVSAKAESLPRGRFSEPWQPSGPPPPLCAPLPQPQPSARVAPVSVRSENEGQRATASWHHLAWVCRQLLKEWERSEYVQNCANSVKCLTKGLFSVGQLLRLVCQATNLLMQIINRGIVPAALLGCFFLLVLEIRVGHIELHLGSLQVPLQVLDLLLNIRPVPHLHTCVRLTWLDVQGGPEILNESCKKVFFLAISIKEWSK